MIPAAQVDCYQAVITSEVCAYYQRMKAPNISMDLILALRYPVGRPHAELLEWYCNCETLPTSFEYNAFNPSTVPPDHRVIH